MLIKIFPVIILVLIGILTLIYGFKKSVKIIIPPFIGITGAIGMTCLINSEINLFGLIACFLVLGFTIDYSIFRTNPEKQTEDAIFVSSLTTMFSFLLLSLCGFKLLSSIATVLFFGILISYIAGFLLFLNQKNNGEN